MIVCGTMCLLLGGTLALLAQEEVIPSAAELQARETQIQKLIEQLGSSDFPVREAAEQALEKLGADTFEALEEAQNHSDLEIAMRAQYLLRRFRVTILDTDPPLVRNLLKNYTRLKTADERIAVLQQLLMLPDRAGWQAICRLVRLEQDESLSKRAALVLITQREPDPNDVPAMLASLPSPLVTGKRKAQEWLRLYKIMLQDRAKSLPEWERMLAEEFTLLKESPNRTSEETVIQFARWFVETLVAAKQHAVASPWIERLLVMREHGTIEEFEEHVDWICHLQLWHEVEPLSRRFTNRFTENALLKYRLAEAKQKLGDPVSAEKIAAEALAFREKSLADHELAANSLMNRGLFTWAEREFRHVLKLAERGTDYDIRVRYTLSEMLHDQAKEHAAAVVIQELLDHVTNDEKARGILERGSRSEESLRSRMNLFYGLAALEKNDFEKAEEHLRESYSEDEDNVDALIALYRLPNAGEESRRQTLSQLRDATHQYQESIREMQSELAEADTPNTEQYYKLQLARLYNDYSWLVGNTEGDYDGAIRASLESLKLRPGTAAYMDTLGRAYYAKGDYANAIKSQTEAIRLEPHSGMMHRQLAMFKAAAEKQKQQDK
jgi:tetratricopeptide (TPR) repeat protein